MIYYKVIWRKNSHIGKTHSYYRKDFSRDLELLVIPNKSLYWGEIWDETNIRWSSTHYGQSVGLLKSHPESSEVIEITQEEMDDYILRIKVIKELVS